MMATRFECEVDACACPPKRPAARRRKAPSGVICRCTGYVYPTSGGVNPIAAVLTAANEMRNAKGGAAA